MKSTIIFLLIASTGLIWTVQQRTLSDKVLFQVDQFTQPIHIQVGGQEQFEFECVSFAFFDSIRLQEHHTTSFPELQRKLHLRILSHDPQDRRKTKLWSQASLDLNHGVLAIQDFKPEQEGDPWWEHVCLLEFHLDSSSLDTISLARVVLSRDSSGNYQTLIGLIGLLWFLAIGFFILRKFMPHIDPDGFLNPQEEDKSSEASPQVENVVSEDPQQKLSQLLPLGNEQEEEWWRELELILMESYSDPELSLQSVAEELQLRKQKIDQLFHTKVQMPFDQFLLELRLHRASNSLINYHGDLERASEEAGFKSLKGFKKAFRIKFNMSPETYYLQSKER